jgi:hypothetical protein
MTLLQVLENAALNDVKLLCKINQKAYVKVLSLCSTEMTKEKRKNLRIICASHDIRTGCF